MQKKVDMAVTTNFTWSHLSGCPHGEYIYEAFFPSVGKFSWKLRLEVPDQSEDAYVRLHLDSLNSSKIETEVTFSISNATQGIGPVTMAHVFSSQSKTLSCKNWLLRKYYDYPVSLGIKESLLKISSKIRIIAIRNVEIPKCRFGDDYGELFKSGEFSDVTISMKSTEFKAHKAILSARSPLFRAMFSHQMKESNSNKVEINDIGEEVVQELLLFMYTGEAPNLNIMAKDLFVAADKYGIERLKIMCEETMSQSLSVDNAVSTLILAELHSSVHLKTVAIDFIAANASKVIETIEWKTEIHSHPRLLMEAFQSVVHLSDFLEKKSRGAVV